MPIDCVIPAAGASSRMGDWKPVLPFGSSTIVGTTLSRALAAPIEGGLRVILVTGYRGQELARLFEGEEAVLVVENPNWRAGMLGSIQAGLARVSSDRFFTIPADMPLVPASAYVSLAQAWTELACGAPEGLPLFASWGGEAGHPVLVPSRLIGDILDLDPGARLRPFLMARGGRLVDCGTEAVLADLDAKADYRAAMAGGGDSSAKKGRP